MNKTTKIFNNIGFYCSINNDYFVPNKSINGYQTLDNSSIGYYIPYLVRNIKDNYKWEIGVGEVQLLDGNIVIKRIEISNSSKNNNKEAFSGSNNEFYLFVNSSNFNTNFHNVVLKNNHFSIDSVTSIYIVDNTIQNIDCSLPDPKTCRNLVVDIKPLSDGHSVIIRDHNGSIFSSVQNPIRLVCDGQTWYSLNQNDKYSSALSYEDNFSAQANPGGDIYSFQYNDGSNGLLGSRLYWSSGNTNKLLLGSSSESLAHSIIPTSGNANTIFNQDLKSSDFIIYGSGQNYRNLFFSYDGRVGINIPSGSRPQTIFHVVNYSCSEILRLENRTTCQPAKLTVYHKPSGLNNGDVCSIVNLAGKDSNNNQKDYAQLYSIASNTTDGYGGLVLSVSSGNNQQSLISGSLNNINIGYNNQQRINLNSNGSVTISGSSFNASTLNSLSIGTQNNTSLTFTNANRNITASFNTLSLGSGSISSQGSLAITNLYPTNLFLDNLATGSLLSVSTSGRILAASGISVSGNSINISNVGSNKILTTSSNGYIQGLYDINDYFLTEQDIIWTKFNARTGSICLKQIIFDADVPVDEFAVGDQVEIVTGTATVYRIVTDIVFDDGFIIELLLDQNVTTTTINAVSVVSITRAGYLTMQKSVVGVIPDSSSNVLSIRPLVDTEFNTGRKDINFAIYGNDPSPALKVYANIGSVERFSGIYTSYATNANDIAAILINTGGSGINSSFSTANFNYNATDNLFSGIVSSVGTNGVDSYYGTYDQNGNVAEWIDPAVKEYTASSQMAAGGSFETISAIGNDPSVYLKSIEYATANSGHDHIGFRVASTEGQTDNNIISSILGLQFVIVTDGDNIPDTGNLYLRNGNSYSLVPIDNLGKVNKNYRIGKYEVTNAQYNIFLNAVATGNDPFSSGLYISDMTNQPEGGIIFSTNGINNSYSIKSNMGNKPVTFVSYINSLKYMNWLHNGAPTGLTSSQSTAEILNDGAYTILPVGSNSYRILTNNTRKYFLPDIHQWHKAAYFQNFNNVVTTGYPVVTVNTDEPYLIASEDVGTNSLTPRTLYGDVTISGWLVVDKIFVKDGTVKSRLTDIGWDPVIPPDPDDEDAGTTQTTGPTAPLPNVPPPLPRQKDGTANTTFWGNKTSVPRLDGVYGETSPPLIPDGTEDMIDLSCDSEELIDTNNLPFWCGEIGRARGPYFYS